MLRSSGLCTRLRGIGVELRSSIQRKLTTTALSSEKTDTCARRSVSWETQVAERLEPDTTLTVLSYHVRHVSFLVRDLIG